MSALTADRAIVGRGVRVHSLLPGQVSYMRETACGFLYPAEHLHPTDAPVSCKHCLAASPVPEEDE